MQGEPVLHHDGVNYGIPPGNMGQGDTSEKKLLLYDSQTETYYNAPVRNIQSYHVQEMISLPQEAINDSNAASASQKAAKPVKKQPANLKMRFRPVGSSYGAPETIGSSSDESDGEKPRSNKEKEERKRKHHHTEDGNQSSSRKKSKKHSSQDEHAPSSQMDVDEESKHKKSKKSSKHRDEKKRRKESA